MNNDEVYEFSGTNEFRVRELSAQMTENAKNYIVFMLYDTSEYVAFKLTGGSYSLVWGDSDNELGEMAIDDPVFQAIAHKLQDIMGFKSNE